MADMRYTKRRRMLEDAHTERLAALRDAEGDSTTSEDEDVWSGSNEEPDETQMMFMERTAAHLQTSPDRTRLAACILANHGTDKRFAFMRSRWRRAWLRTQAKVAASTAAEEDKKIFKTTKPVLMDLATYGDSDGDGSEAGEALEVLVKEVQVKRRRWRLDAPEHENGLQNVVPRRWAFRGIHQISDLSCYDRTAQKDT